MILIRKLSSRDSGPVPCSLPGGDPVRKETHQLHAGHLKEPQSSPGGSLQCRGGSHRSGHPHRAHDKLPGTQRGGCTLESHGAKSWNVLFRITACTLRQHTCVLRVKELIHSFVLGENVNEA